MWAYTRSPTETQKTIATALTAAPIVAATPSPWPGAGVRATGPRFWHGWERTVLLARVAAGALVYHDRHRQPPGDSFPARTAGESRPRRLAVENRKSTGTDHDYARTVPDSYR